VSTSRAPPLAVVDWWWRRGTAGSRPAPRPRPSRRSPVLLRHLLVEAIGYPDGITPSVARAAGRRMRQAGRGRWSAFPPWA
jgi:hypothetical protein